MGVTSEQCPQERFPTSRPCLQSVSWGVRGQLLRPIINASCGLRPGVSTTKRPTLLPTTSTSCKTDLYSQLEKSMGIGSLWVIDQPASSESIVHWLKWASGFISPQLTARWRRCLKQMTQVTTAATGGSTPFFRSKPLWHEPGFWLLGSISFSPIPSLKRKCIFW